MTIGERAYKAISDRANQKSVGILEYAKSIGISQPNLSHWKNARTEPRAYLLSLMAEAGLDVHWILTEKRGGLAMSNPYWDNVCAIAERQRAKGIATYSQGIEMNPADAITRIEHLQEELVDALMYCEWIKDGIKNTVSVVRCKDCASYGTDGCADGFGLCALHDRGKMDFDFCSCGGRRGYDATD